MKIVQLVTKRQYRGAEVFAAALSSDLHKNKHSVYFVSLYKHSEVVLVAEGVPNIDLNGRKYFVDLLLLYRLIVLLKKVRPDIVQANGSDTLKYAVLAKLFISDVQIIYRNISVVSVWLGRSPFRKSFNRWLFRHVSYVTSVGRKSLDDLIETYRYPRQRTQVIRRGVAFYSFDRDLSRMEIANRFGFSENDPLLVHVGQFSDEKNHVFIIAAFRKIVEARPTARLLLIGEGKNMEAVKSLINEYGLTNSVFLAGHSSQVQQFLSGCDIFLLASLVEGLPGVLLEASLQKLPSIAVNVGSVPEIVLDGITGLLINDHNEDVFAAGAIRLIDDKDLRAELGSNARDMVMQEFGMKRSSEAFEQLYINCIKKLII